MNTKIPGRARYLTISSQVLGIGAPRASNTRPRPGFQLMSRSYSLSPKAFEASKVQTNSPPTRRKPQKEASPVEPTYSGMCERAGDERRRRQTAVTSPDTASQCNTLHETRGTTFEAGGPPSGRGNPKILTSPASGPFLAKQGCGSLELRGVETSYAGAPSYQTRVIGVSPLPCPLHSGAKRRSLLRPYRGAAFTPASHAPSEVACPKAPPESQFQCCLRSNQNRLVIN
ncbi:hypothetical protein VUR80DRAFT_532 [Thermomyces stellatus]